MSTPTTADAHAPTAAVPVAGSMLRKALRIGASLSATGHSFVRRPVPGRVLTRGGQLGRG